MDIASIKQHAWQTIAHHEAEVRALALRIWEHPEVGYQEAQASAWLAEYLAQQGFSVTKPFGGLPTAFNACREHGNGPTVAILAEYDALPEIGHGCGHNLLGSASVAAGLGVASVIEQLGGRICVMGTPAEEFANQEEGKTKLLKAGVFEGIDIAIGLHPDARESAILSGDNGFVGFELVFHGRPAHAAADPWNGANALDGLLLTFANINALRQHVQPDVRMHGIISEGGVVPNVIPERAAGRFMVRASEPRRLDEVYARAQDCARAAALATGTTVDIIHITTVYNTLFNATLNRLVAENFALAGEPLAAVPRVNSGSTDFGNVSQVVPSTWFTIKTHPDGIPWHSADSARCSKDETALRGMMTGARIMCGAIIDVMSDPAVLAQVRADFTG